MEVVKFPPAIHTAFNPVYLELRSATKKETIIEIEVDGTAADYTELKKDAINQRFRFNLTGVLKKKFRDEVEQLQPGIFSDRNLFVMYNLFGDGFGSENIIALNAVAQIGESSDLTSQYGTFRTQFERLKVYEHYPIDVAVIGYPDTTIINGAIEFNELNPFFSLEVDPTRSYISIANQLSNETLTTNNSEVITTNQGEVIYIKLNNGLEERRLPLERACTPSSPFYVRWINQLGGWDYWMFSYRQFGSRSVSDINTFKPTIMDQQIVRGTEVLLSLEPKETITIGAYFLTSNEYDVLSRLPYSPNIQYFKDGIWQTLIIDKADSERNTRAESHALEFTLRLPEPQLQF